MFKNTYIRCKEYLNSKSSMCIFFLLFLSLFVPTLIPRESTNFFFDLIFNYQCYTSCAFVTFLLIINSLLYIRKSINIGYQAHRLGSMKKIVKENVKDLIFISLVYELVYLILNIAFSLFVMDGLYSMVFKYANTDVFLYLLFLIGARIIVMVIINILVYVFYCINSKVMKIILMLFLFFNIIFYDDRITILFSSYLMGANFVTFKWEVTSFIIFSLFWISILFILIKMFMIKKRDI